MSKPEEMLCVPQPSSVSLAAARLGWAAQDTVLVSIHGRPMERVIRHLRQGARIFVLAWDGESAGALAALLVARGFGGSTLHIMEALGGPRDRVRSTSAQRYDLGATDPLVVIAIECVATERRTADAARTRPSA